MKFGDKLLRLYFFRVTPGQESSVAEELSERLRKHEVADRWAFYSWLGRFDLVAVSETNKLFGQDSFMFREGVLANVRDVAEIVAFQVEMEGETTCASLGEVLVPSESDKPGDRAPWVALTVLKLDHERLLDRSTVKAFHEVVGLNAPESDVLPYCWNTQIAAMKALRRKAAEFGGGRGRFQVGIGGGLGDSEIVVACRFTSHSMLFDFLEGCCELAVSDLMDGPKRTAPELAAPLFLGSFTQTGIDHEVLKAAFGGGECHDLGIPGSDEEVNALLQCSGPRSRTVPGVSKEFPAPDWVHLQLLGAIDDAFLCQRPMKAGELMRKWVQVRRTIGACGRSSNRDRTELGIVRLSTAVGNLADAARPELGVAGSTDGAPVDQFMDTLQDAPQELRAIEHVLERRAALRQNSGASLALVDFWGYFAAVTETVDEYVRKTEMQAILREKARKALEEGTEEVSQDLHAAQDVADVVQELDRNSQLLRDEQATDLRKLTDTVRLFDAALTQRVGAETEDLLTAGFCSRASSHMGSLSRLIMGGAYLAHAVYQHVNLRLREAGEEAVDYEGFVVYCRDNEAWNFSRDIAQLPDSVLWHPEEAGILLHEIGHQLARKVDLDKSLLNAGRELWKADLKQRGVSSSDEMVSGMYRDLSNLWADLFWCAMARAPSENGVREFVHDRLTWLAHRHYRYTTADLRRSVGRLFAITACYELLEHPLDETNLAEWIRTSPRESALALLQEEYKKWCEDPESTLPKGAAWIPEFLGSVLRNSEKEFDSGLRYRHAIVMALAIDYSRKLQATLGVRFQGCGTAERTAEEEWKQLRTKIETGEMPKPNVSPRALKQLPQIIIARLSREKVLDGNIGGRLALSMWLWDLFVREVVRKRWETIASSQPSVNSDDEKS